MKRIFPFLLSFAFLFLLFYFLPPREIINFLKLITLKSFFLASFLYGMSHITRSLRWKILLKDLSFSQAFLINSANVFLNNLLPARTGELSWFYYSRKLGVSLSASLVVFLWGRLLDLLSLFILLTFFYALQKGYIYLSLLPILLFITIFLHFPLKKFKGLNADFYSSVWAFALSLVSGLLKFSSLMFLAGLEPSVLLFTSFLGGELSTVLPIHSFGGFGTYELSFSLPQKLLGENLKDPIKLAFVFHVFLLLSSALYGIPSLLLLHRRLSKP
ncbi:lysylphosphatidylglycerol synthase domain-containing protein [Thermocrinis sp.]